MFSLEYPFYWLATTDFSWVYTDHFARNGCIAPEEFWGTTAFLEGIWDETMQPPPKKKKIK